jgi:hypothetical protein
MKNDVRQHAAAAEIDREFLYLKTDLPMEGS